MTPKEKAEKLVDALYQTTPNEAWFNPPLGSLSINYKAWQQAKECALIAVDEILEDSVEMDGMRITYNQYWIQVKREIEKL